MKSMFYEHQQHHPTAYGRYMRGEMASCQALSCPVGQRQVVVLFWGMQSPRTWIFAKVLTAWVPMSDFCTEHIAFIKIRLPYAGIITVCIHVSLAELPFWIVMGRISVL
jgi:hypothetical protein